MSTNQWTDFYMIWTYVMKELQKVIKTNYARFQKPTSLVFEAIT